MTKQLSIFVVLIVLMCAQTVFHHLTLQKAEEKFQKELDIQAGLVYNKETEIAELKERVVILTDELEKEQTRRIVESIEVEKAINHSGNLIDVKVTHYSADEAGGLTASGVVPTPGYTVACNFLPIGTHVIIDGCEYEVQDTGGMAGNVVDIFVSSYGEAISRGTYYTTMEVLD